ncbi:MAG: cysteine desulfurase [Firmicutes bacterium]|nr:cysteine desulfurase [Bacillota bacterium]
MEVYLDNSATTKPTPEVIMAINRAYTEYYGNPSSLHRKGLEAERVLFQARREIASAIGAAPEEFLFTSGGTESNNLAILGFLKRSRHLNKLIATTKIEHPSVLNVFKKLESDGFEVAFLNVDSSGVVNLDEVKAVLDKEPVLLSVMMVNNETGALQPIAEIAQLLRSSGKKTVFHVDAVQAFGKVPFQVNSLNIDLLSISGHKFHGPKGVGALFVKKGVGLEPLFFGGNQEAGLRSGTENLPAILGMNTAAEQTVKSLTEDIAKMRSLKNRLQEEIERNIPDIRINSPSEANCAPHILNVSFLGVKSEILLHTLEQDGIYVSSGSACSSRKRSISHVLQAMGRSEAELDSAVRFSFNRFNESAEIDYVVDRLQNHVAALRKTIMGDRKWKR